MNIIFMILAGVIVGIAGMAITGIAIDTVERGLGKLYDKLSSCKFIQKRQRKADLKKKYGFDDSYDKYIA